MYNAAKGSRSGENGRGNREEPDEKREYRAYRARYELMYTGATETLLCVQEIRRVDAYALRD